MQENHDTDMSWADTDDEMEEEEEDIDIDSERPHSQPRLIPIY